MSGKQISQGGDESRDTVEGLGVGGEGKHSGRMCAWALPTQTGVSEIITSQTAGLHHLSSPSQQPTLTGSLLYAGLGLAIQGQPWGCPDQTEHHETQSAHHPVPLPAWVYNYLPAWLPA